MCRPCGSFPSPGDDPGPLLPLCEPLIRALVFLATRLKTEQHVKGTLVIVIIVVVTVDRTPPPPQSMNGRALKSTLVGGADFLFAPPSK